MIALALTLAPVVAVLPLGDVTGQAGPGGYGEALRAAVEAELDGAPGLRRVERAAVDEAAAKTPDAVRVIGRSVGATLVVAGAWKPGATPKVWVRLHWAVTGKIAGTLTLAAQPADVLVSAGEIAAHILETVGVPRAARRAFAARPRPRLRSDAAAELWGDARVADDAERKRHLLQRALDEDPTFAHAARDLDAVERALPPRDEAAQAEQARAFAAATARLKERLARETDPVRIVELYLERFGALQKQRRYRALIAEAQAVISHPPPEVAALPEQLPESALYLVVAAYDHLNDDDALVREGQKFLARYPLSDGFPVVRQLVDQAMARKQARAAGARQAAEAIAKLSEAERADPCRVAAIEEANAQLEAAREALKSCLARGPSQEALVRLLWVHYHLGEFAEVTRVLARLRSEAPSRYKQVMHVAGELPVD